MEQDKIKLVVVNEHTLGFIFPPSAYNNRLGLTFVNILHASILKGAVNTARPILIGSTDKVRLASENDFNNFRVCFNGYNSKEYLYQRV